jgi:phospholipase/carboxylesterase
MKVIPGPLSVGLASEARGTSSSARTQNWRTAARPKRNLRFPTRENKELGCTAAMKPRHFEGILAFRPRMSRVSAIADAGTRPIGLQNGRDGLLHVPPDLLPSAPIPLIVLLHGAGGRAAEALPIFRDCADRHSILVLAPDSRGNTWDVIQRRAYGPDVAFIEDALDRVSRDFPVDPARLAIAGFSDGASYALSLGLANPSLFSHILAFSPGFHVPHPATKAPRMFISHGAEDEVLPIERCGRRVARELSRSGYDVDYREFVGGHVVPAEMSEAACRRFLSTTMSDD